VAYLIRSGLGVYNLALNQSFSQRLDVDESRAWQRPFRDLTRGDLGGFESSPSCQLCRGCCCGFYLIYFALPSFILFFSALYFPSSFSLSPFRTSKSLFGFGLSAAVGVLLAGDVPHSPLDVRVRVRLDEGVDGSDDAWLVSAVVVGV